MNMNIKSDNQKLSLEGNQGITKLEKEYQSKQEIVENLKTEMALLQAGINRLAVFSTSVTVNVPFMLTLQCRMK